MAYFEVCGILNDDIGFGVIVADEDYDKAKQLCEAGLEAWLGDELQREKWFPKYSEDSGFWDTVGYTEPATELMNAAGIAYKITDMQE